VILFLAAAERGPTEFSRPDIQVPVGPRSVGAVLWTPLSPPRMAEEFDLQSRAEAKAFPLTDFDKPGGAGG